MKTKMRFEHMQKALPYAVELMESDSLKSSKKSLIGKEKSAGQIMSEMLPILLEEKQDAVMGLLGALHGKTAVEIAEQDWNETKELLSDLSILDDLADFFIFSVRVVKNM